MLIALLVCLIPTTIGGLLSAIGIAGMDRLVRHNVLAMTGRAVEAAGDVDTLLLDKTGTITLGNRQAAEFIPVPRRRPRPSSPTPPSSPRSPTRRPRAARSSCWPRASASAAATSTPRSASFIQFTAQTRMSGIDLDGHVHPQGRRRGRHRLDPPARRRRCRPSSSAPSQQVSLQGGTPLAVARDDQVLGVIHLKDIVKGGIRERFDELRAMGIRTVMITGDNPLTAAVIAKEAGVDDFLAEATPEAKMELIQQRAGSRASWWP